MSPKEWGGSGPFKQFISAAASNRIARNDFIIPFYVKYELFAWCERLGQVDAHHGLIDGIRQRLAGFIGHTFNIDAILGQFTSKIQAIELAIGERRFEGIFTEILVVFGRAMLVFIEL